ncbi:MAG: ethanolamine ammonia-lyase subunit EutC [Oxalobacteraceae bacterium]|nr:ethanolamine ammonia-lyase subunit EutC [Oxalobacteraceae bacterium]
MSKRSDTVVTNPWGMLRQFTSGRIALGRTGISLPTTPQLEFQLAHARARDAVHHELNVDILQQAVMGLQSVEQCVVVESSAGNRATYLQRPDLGRRLSSGSRQQLQLLASQSKQVGACDLAFVIADGLSALAVETNAVPFLKAVLERLAQDGLSLAPVTIVRQGRVAVGDEVGELLGAKLVVVLIGERPGLSSPDSMGLYMTWGPRVGLTDESRNCISNVRPAGLSYEEASYKLHYLVSEALRREVTGVQLKDETPASQLEGRLSNFLLGS